MTLRNKNPHKLTRDLVILVVVLSLAIILPVTYLSAQAQRKISEQFIDNAAERAVGKFSAMAESMTATLGLVRDWGETELFSIEETDKLNRLLFPIFARENLLYGVSVADIDGNSYYVRLEADGLRTSQINAKQTKRQSVVTLWDAEYNKINSEANDSDYDPRRRPWFTPALSEDDISWTEPYKFFASGAVGVTASISYLRKNDQKPVVVAFDILLDKLFTEMSNSTPSANSRIFIFRRDAKLYVPKTLETESEFLALSSVQEPLVREAYSNWIGEENLGEKVLSIQHEGTTWWSGFLPLDNVRRTTWVCVMIPEQDIITQAGKLKMKLWLVCLGSVFLAISLAAWIYRNYGRKLEKTENSIFDVNDPETSICKIIERGEGPEVEFKSTIRMNLHTKKPGKEIELAWLKSVAAFLNTNGGILLLGVTDSGEITGLEKDVFENEDKCKLHFKNLIAQHVGTVLSKHIRFQIIPVKDKTVGVVVCDRSTEPVFLKTNKSEAFYIRNGPSSDELPVSMALNYIKSRK
jgi:hypothetical protein